MNYAEIKYNDIANGVGIRTSLFVSGCRRHCLGCFNKCAWSFSYGNKFTCKVQQEILDSLKPFYVDGLTVLGGDPMEPENQIGLVEFVEEFRRIFPSKTLWMYTGYEVEDILHGTLHTEVSDRLLGCVDVLVDGPYIESLKDITLKFRGSSNQRILDVRNTLRCNHPVLWQDFN